MRATKNEEEEELDSQKFSPVARVQDKVMDRRRRRPPPPQKVPSPGLEIKVSVPPRNIILLQLGRRFRDREGWVLLHKMHVPGPTRECIGV